VHGQRFPRDKPRSQLGQFPFCLSGKIAVEMLGNHELEHRIAQELEALVIEMIAMRLVAQTGMRKRLRQQQRIPKLVTNPFFERVHPSEC
jgi:hypothetical protein